MLYLLHYQLLPEKRLAALMADLFGVKLVTATIARISQDCAVRFQGFADELRDLVTAAPVKHMDADRFTGVAVGSNGGVLASTVWLTFYRTSPKRGSLLAKVTGIIANGLALVKASQPWQRPDGAAAHRGAWAIICCYASALVGWTCYGS